MARSKKKKWKSRIKKALKLAAIGGAGYLAAKRFGGKKATVADTAASEDANIGVTHPALTATAPVIKTDTAPAVAAVAADTDSSFQSPFKRKVDGKWMGPNEIRMLNAQTAGNKVPPSMRGGALHAEGYQRRVPGGGRKTPSWTGGYSLYKKGGRVTGIAKRGFGRALMKGKK